MSHKPGPLAGHALTGSFTGSRLWQNHHKLDCEVCKGQLAWLANRDKPEPSLGWAQRPCPVWCWTKGQEGSPGPGTDIHSRGNSTSKLSSTQHTAQCRTQKKKQEHNTLSLEGGWEVHIACQKRKKKFPPSTKRFLKEFDYFGPRAALHAKQKPWGSLIVLFPASIAWGKVKAPPQKKLTNLVYTARPCLQSQIPKWVSWLECLFHLFCFHGEPLYP